MEKRKVIVKPLQDRGFEHLPANHDGKFMFTNCSVRYTLPRTLSGNYKQILTEKEIKEFAELLGEDAENLKFTVSKTQKQPRFWKYFGINLDKSEISLDLSDPTEYLKYLILKEQPDICPIPTDINKSASYRYVIIDEDFEETQRIKKKDVGLKAYKLLGQVTASKAKALNVAIMLGLKVDENNTLEEIEAKLYEFIDNDNRTSKDKNMYDFIQVAEDSDLEMKLFIRKAISAQEIENVGGEYYNSAKEKIATDMDSLLKYIKKPTSKAWVKTIETRITNS